MSVTNLISCCILEKDINDETILVWAFPTISKPQEKYLLRKCSSIHLHSSFFAFAKYGKEWCYISVTQAFSSEHLPQVKKISFVIWAKDYNVEKYENLCRVLNKRYCKLGNPSLVLQLYLSVMTRGACNTEENGLLLTADFECNKTGTNGQLKDLIKLFGLEIIIVYTALLLNKRLLIYHHSLESLLGWIQTIPFLMIHKNFDDKTFPWVNLENDELADLKYCDGFIAGSTDNGIGLLTEIYDVFVNIPAREISISPQSRDYFVMTKTHKDIALFMVQLSEKSNLEEQEIVKGIANKTKELLTQLRLLACVTTSDGHNLISMENLKEKKLVPALENFLFNLSIAEKMIVL